MGFMKRRVRVIVLTDQGVEQCRPVGGARGLMMAALPKRVLIPPGNVKETVCMWLINPFCRCIFFAILCFDFVVCQLGRFEFPVPLCVIRRRRWRPSDRGRRRGCVPR